MQCWYLTAFFGLTLSLVTSRLSCYSNNEETSHEEALPTQDMDEETVTGICYYYYALHKWIAHQETGTDMQGCSMTKRELLGVCWNILAARTRMLNPPILKQRHPLLFVYFKRHWILYYIFIYWYLVWLLIYDFECSFLNRFQVFSLIHLLSLHAASWFSIWSFHTVAFKGQWGVPLTVYPWYLLCSLGILGDYNP